MSDVVAAPAPSPDIYTQQNRITVARLNRIASLNGARRYLEVGVFKGQTFLNLNFAEMDAVDPGFQFDPSVHQAPNRRFHAMTSDAFFRATPPRTYDLIFLDGLHTFEQTFRDFCATMAYAHPGTVWVIDDTVPCDLFSAMRSQSEANRLRSQLGVKGRKWHGDVFKMLFAVHDFFPSFDYRTVVGNGNEQTVIIRQPRADFAPRWNDMEAISRLEYTGFVENRALVQPVSNEEMFDWLTQADLGARR